MHRCLNARVLLTLPLPKPKITFLGTENTVSYQSLQISICNLTALGHVCLGDKLEAEAQEVLWPSCNVCEDAWPVSSS